MSDDPIQPNKDKLDALLTTAVALREELQVHIRRIVISVIIGAIAILIMFGSAVGVLWGLKEQTSRITEIARENKENGEAIRSVVGPEAAARSDARVAGAINELQRVGICAALYATKEYPPACADITASMNRIRSGGAW